MRNERPGVAFLSAMAGQGVAKVYAQSNGAVLLEWLDGPSLGDLSRNGQDDQANVELVQVANTIHQGNPALGIDLPTLHDWFRALLDLRFGACYAPELRHNVERSQVVARYLLSSMVDVRPLHGDLHHDNVRRGDRGYCAFDAKGVLGERTYELANAFRNPKGVPGLVRSPKRIKHLSSLWSRLFAVDQQRLLQWATVKCALSIAWRSKHELVYDDEADLLAALRQMMEQI